MKYAWIDEQADKDLWWFSVALACEVLEVSTSGFYDWRARRDRPPTPRELEQQRLLADIRRFHDDSHGRYGSPRIWADLREEGWVVGVNRVARLMAAHGIQGRSGRKPGPTTTRPAEFAPQIPDLVERDFAGVATAPDRLWCTDLTYVPTAQGWLYLTIILDACSRAIVGWAAADHMRATLMTDALAVALGRRRPDPGLIVHSDRGSQYTSDAWLRALEAAGALPPMGRVGWCWDNAMAESWFAGFKNELVAPIGEFDTRHQAHSEIVRYVRWHNLSRRSPGVLGLWRDVAPGPLTGLSATVLQRCGARGHRAQTACLRPSGASNVASAEKCRPCATPVVHVAGRRCPPGPPSAQILAFRLAGPLEKRRHSALGQLAPAVYERALTMTETTRAA